MGRKCGGIQAEKLVKIEGSRHRLNWQISPIFVTRKVIGEKINGNMLQLGEPMGMPEQRTTVLRGTDYRIAGTGKTTTSKITQ